MKGTPEPQAALDKVKIKENRDSLVDLRDIPRLTFRTTPGHETIPLLRAPVAEMLSQAVIKIPLNYNLHVVSALRDIKHQEELWVLHYKKVKDLHPDWPHSLIRREVNKYIAPIDHPAPPGHCTGAAVDVVLQKHDGSFVDLVPPDIANWELAHTWTDKIDPETKKLRMLLVDAMLSVGFANCRDEYWHYSYGDSGWAVRTGKSECCYGIIKIPKDFKHVRQIA